MMGCLGLGEKGENGKSVLLHGKDGLVFPSVLQIVDSKLKSSLELQIIQPGELSVLTL